MWRKNTLTEISLAGRQAVSKIKSEIASLIVAKSIGEGGQGCGLDASFIREMLVSVAKNWNGADSGERSNCRRCFRRMPARSSTLPCQECQDAARCGHRGRWSKEVKTGFKVGARDGGYYISFTDADLEALLGEYLRDKVYQLLFKA